MVVEHILVELIARTIAHCVVDYGIVINVLMLVGNYTTVQETFATFAAESQIELIAGYSIMKRDNVVRHTAVALLVDVNI